MALSLSLRRLVRLTAVRRALPSLYYSSVASEGTIPTDAEQATGLEKREVDALLSGVEDPFNMKVAEGPWGTKDKPHMVPSMLNERLVGCVCDEDSTSVNWMKLEEGPAQRCECGNWYQLTQASSIKC